MTWARHFIRLVLVAAALLCLAPACRHRTAPPAPQPVAATPEPSPTPPVTPPAEPPARIAFARHDGLYTIAPGEKKAKRLLPVDSIYQHDGFDISANGRWAAVLRRASEEIDNPICLYDLQTKKEVEFKDIIMGNTVGFLPDNRHLAYLCIGDQEETEGYQNAIYILNLDDGKTVCLHSGKGFQWDAGGRIVCTHDGKSLLLRSNRQLWAVDLASGTPHRLAPDASDSLDTLSPDGQRLVTFDERGIYTARRDGTDMRRLSDVKKDKGAELHDNPEYSPDGKFVVFEREWKTGKTGYAEGVDKYDITDTTICLMHADGSGVKRLSQGWTPRWVRLPVEK